MDALVRDGLRLAEGSASEACAELMALMQRADAPTRGELRAIRLLLCDAQEFMAQAIDESDDG